jgi:hypothetical protein
MQRRSCGLLQTFVSRPPSTLGRVKVTLAASLPVIRNRAARSRSARREIGYKSEDFVAALYNDFQEHGSAAIAACRAEKPDVYVRVIAGILPKDVHLKVQSLDDLTDDQLMRKLAVLTEMAKPLLARLPAVIDAAPDAAPVRADVGAETNTEGKYR